MAPSKEDVFTSSSFSFFFWGGEGKRRAGGGGIGVDSLTFQMVSEPSTKSDASSLNGSKIILILRTQL